VDAGVAPALPAAQGPSYTPSLEIRAGGGKSSSRSAEDPRSSPTRLRPQPSRARPRAWVAPTVPEVLAQLRKPRTLVLLVYLTPKPVSQRHAPPPLKLLGRVALGHHPAGLSQITWGLRVHGHRLGAGDYLAELEALIGDELTTGGPTVDFDVGQRGKPTIVAQSCPAHASADATAATVC
jgi:hypothetical protein